MHKIMCTQLCTLRQPWVSVLYHNLKKSVSRLLSDFFLSHFLLNSNYNDKKLSTRFLVQVEVNKIFMKYGMDS